MAPTVRDSTVNAAVDTASVVVTKPAGTASGDLLVAINFATADGPVASMTGATGFVQHAGIQTVTDGSFGMHGKVWTKTAGGSEPADYTFGGSVTSDGSGVILIAITTGTYDTASPFDVAATWAGTATNTGPQIAPDVAPTSADTLLICAWASHCFNNVCTYTTASGMTEIEDFQPVGNYIAMSAQTETRATAGATGTRTATASRASFHATLSLAVRVPAGPPQENTQNANAMASIIAR